MKIGSRASLKDRQLGVDDRPNSSDGFVELAALGKLDVSGVRPGIRSRDCSLRIFLAWCLC